MLKKQETERWVDWEHSYTEMSAYLSELPIFPIFIILIMLNFFSYCNLFINFFFTF